MRKKEKAYPATIIYDGIRTMEIMDGRIENNMNTIIGAHLLLSEDQGDEKTEDWIIDLGATGVCQRARRSRDELWILGCGSMSWSQLISDEIRRGEIITWRQDLGKTGRRFWASQKWGEEGDLVNPESMKNLSSMNPVKRGIDAILIDKLFEEEFPESWRSWR